MLGLSGAREATAPQPESDWPATWHGEMFVSGFDPGPIGFFRVLPAKQWANVDCALDGQTSNQVPDAGVHKLPDDAISGEAHVLLSIAGSRSAPASGDPVSGVSRVMTVCSGPTERLRAEFDSELYKLVAV